MNRIVDWLRRMRLGHRQRRVELLGGHPAREPIVEVESFTPDLAKERRIRWVRDNVAKMGRDSFDDATGNALKSLITADGDHWAALLDQQCEAYKSRARQQLVRANAVVGQQRQLLQEDLTRLRHSETAVETSVMALSGQPLTHLNGHARTIRLAAEPSEAEPPGTAAGADANVAPDISPQDPRAPGPAHDQNPATEANRPAVQDVAPLLGLPSVGQTELRRLLEPRDASRVPQWAEPGFRDGTLLAGRPKGTYLHALALVLAAGADIGAFTQTVQLVLPQSAWVSLMVVAGLTAVVLYIAHMVGVMLRDAKAAASGEDRRLRARIGRLLVAYGGLLVWLSVGVLAFWVRYKVPLPVTPQVGGCGIGSGAGGGCSTAGSGNPHPLQAAAIFLGLYIATGVVAAIGAYVTHNPHRGGYVSAIRAYRKASERVAGSLHRFGLAQAAWLRQEGEIVTADRILASAKEENTAFTTELQQVALIEIASMLKDPAVTDAFFA